MLQMLALPRNGCEELLAVKFKMAEDARSQVEKLMARKDQIENEIRQFYDVLQSVIFSILLLINSFAKII